ncbi:MAG: zinc-binding dehydrogenase [Alphaproteobacteria bacterium]|nr:zinc-binding dehydrogenase [Alphaproteobacteria bacterium]
MRALRIHEFGGPEVMRFDDVPVPQPADDELLLRVHAASVNPVDYKTREGKFGPVGEDQLPLTLGRDVSGTVEACGRRVEGFRPGDEAYAMLAHDRGAFAEYVILKEDEASPKPGGLGHVEAASVPLAALTAWQGLFDHGGLQAGQRVLIHGAAGGVGHFAVQFAREKGARVHVTVSERDVEFARRLGADEVIDYRSERFEDRARDMDLVFDLIAGDTQQRSWSVLKPGGTMVSTLGPPSEDEARAHHARGVGYMAEPNGGQLAAIGRMIEAGSVVPEIDATFPFDDARAAETHKQEDHVRGKVVLRLA